MKRCPHCTGAIQDDALVCPLCKTSLTGIPTPSPAAPMGGTAFPPSPAGGETSGKAIGSLVFGLLSVIILPFFASIPAVILGHLSLSEIKKSAGRLQGKGMAIAGLVMGYVSVVLLIPFVLIIAAIAIPNLLRAKMAANEASAVGSLRTYNIAIVNYAATCPDIGFPGSVIDLGPGDGKCKGANLVDSLLARPTGQKAGYRFFYSPGPADNTGHVVSYTITADPITENTTGSRHFFTDESGVIRMSRAAPASADSAPIAPIR